MYRPRGAALAIFKRKDDEVLLSGPAGTGKSRAALEKLHMVALRNPQMRGLIVRKTAVSLGSTALVTWREHVAPEALATGIVEYYGGSQEEPPQYRYENGSKIMIGGMDKPTKIMSSEYDMAYVQEAIELTPNDWEAITTRLRNGRLSYQQLLADTNPDAPHHWLKRRADAGQTVMLESRHEDNPVLFDDNGQMTKRGAAYLAKLDRLTGPRYYRLRKGLWVSAEGIVFESYDPLLHLVPRFEIPIDWPRYWVVDFGYTNPFVLQCWAQDPDGRLYRYREIYHTKRLVVDHAEKILSIVRPNGHDWLEPAPVAIICDHDAEDRATLERALGRGTVAATKTVSDGLQAVEQRWKPAGDGKPRLFLMRDSLVEKDQELEDLGKPTCSEEEIVGYVWDTSAGKVKENPVKVNDHGMDTIRYVVAEFDLGGRPRVRWM